MFSQFFVKNRQSGEDVPPNSPKRANSKNELNECRVSFYLYFHLFVQVTGGVVAVAVNVVVVVDVVSRISTPRSFLYTKQYASVIITTEYIQIHGENNIDSMEFYPFTVAATTLPSLLLILLLHFNIFIFLSLYFFSSFFFSRTFLLLSLAFCMFFFTYISCANSECVCCVKKIYNFRIVFFSSHFAFLRVLVVVIRKANKHCTKYLSFSGCICFWKRHTKHPAKTKIVSRKYSWLLFFFSYFFGIRVSSR